MRIHRLLLIAGLAAAPAASLSAQRGSSTLPPAAPPPAPIDLTPRAIANVGSITDLTVSPLFPNRVYHSTSWDDDNKLMLYDRSTKTSTVIAEGEFWNLDLSPKGDRLAFARTAQDDLSYIWTLPLDPATGAARGAPRRVALTHADQPHFSPDGAWIAFSAYDSATAESPQHVNIVSAEGGPERQVTKTLGGIGRIRWTPDGRTLYILARERKTVGPFWGILRVSVSTGAAEPLGHTGPGSLILSPGGTRMLVKAAPNEIHALLDPDGKDPVRVRTPAPFEPAAWLGENKLLVSGSSRSSAVHTLSIENGTTREVAPARTDVARVFWSPDGKLLATLGTTATARVVYVMNADGSGRRQLGASGELHGDRLLWSPDGKTIVVNGPDAKAMNVIDVATGAVRRMGVTLANGVIRWRSDSRAILYTWRPDRTRPVQSLRELTLDGRERAILDLPFIVGWVSLINDTTALVNSDSGMFRVSTRTGAWTRESSRHAEHLEVDRTGQRIAVMESPEATSDIGVSILNALGKAGSTFRLPFRCTALSSSCAFFHPDGEQLVIAGRANNRSAIYTVRIADGQVRKVADTPALRGPGYLALSPDGKQLVFTVPGQSVSQIAEVDLPPVTRR